jgi:hypothetical protein
MFITFLFIYEKKVLFKKCRFKFMSQKKTFILCSNVLCNNLLYMCLSPHFRLTVIVCTYYYII